MTEYEEYQQTGMLGGYKPERAHLYQTEDGKAVAAFRDASYCERDGCAVIEREMFIDGCLYRIHSVFEPDAKCTPTDAMLRMIDADLEKDSI